jgi:hypothetical protein
MCSSHVLVKPPVATIARGLNSRARTGTSAPPTLPAEQHQLGGVGTRIGHRGANTGAECGHVVVQIGFTARWPLAVAHAGSFDPYQLHACIAHHDAQHVRPAVVHVARVLGGVAREPRNEDHERQAPGGAARARRVGAHAIPLFASCRTVDDVDAFDRLERCAATPWQRFRRGKRGRDEQPDQEREDAQHEASGELRREAALGNLRKTLVVACGDR